MFLRCTFTVLGLTLVPILAIADEEGPWSGKASLGYLATTGNTENSNLNSAFQLGYKTGPWQHLLTALAINAAENKETTAEAYELGWKSERNMSEKDFLFGRLNWRKDRFSGYDTQFSQSVGYGRRLINTDIHKLNIEAGAGARQSTRIDGAKENETIFRAGLNYTLQFSETAQFRQNFVVEAGQENTYLESISAVSAKLYENFALVASYTVKNNSDVPPLTEKTDTYTAISLEYVF